MLKEFAELLAEQGAAAEKAKIVELPAEMHAFGIWQPDGSLETKRLLPMPRCHEVLSLASLFAVLDDLNEKDIDGAESYSVWVSGEAIIALEDFERRDRVRFPLTLTEQFERVKSWEDSLQSNQKQILYILRTVFPDMAGNDLEAILRGLKWDIESDLSHDRSSVGKSIKSKHSNAGSIPEVVVFTVPVWQELDYRETIPVAIQANPENQTITLKTIAGTAEQGKRHALEQLFEATTGLAKNTWPVFLGTP